MNKLTPEEVTSLVMLQSDGSGPHLSWPGLNEANDPKVVRAFALRLLAAASEMEERQAEPGAEWSYSLDEETYHGRYDTREEAEAAGNDALDDDDSEQTGFWVAEVNPIRVTDLFDAGRLIDDMAESANDLVGEAADGWLEMSSANLATATAELQELILPAVEAWVEKHDSIAFYGVKTATRVSVERKPEKGPEPEIAKGVV